LPALSVVIPAYNEEKRLPPSLERMVEYLARSQFSPTEIVVVDDGSSDDTAGAVRLASERLGREGLTILLLENPGNRGKGYSVRHGMLQARHEWALFSDADLSAPIEEVEKLVDAAQRGPHDGAIGSRASDRSLIGVRQPLLRELMGRFFNVVMRLGAGLSYSDTQCGFKLFRREAAQQIFQRQRLDGFGFDVEILYIAKQIGLSIAEVAVRWNDVEGTKVGALQGVDAFADILRVRWNGLRGLYR
jgi:glycosyltransferase involved in cell wall biosynthesis